MTPRKFAIGLIIAGGAMFAGTVIANVVIDPHAVFGTKIFPPANANQRFVVFEEWRHNRASVDALLFGSSHGYALDEKYLAERMGVEGLNSQIVPGGAITDHVPILSYVLRHQEASGRRIRKVLLLVDIDSIGGYPCTDVAINCLLPPQVTGASRVNFWWRYLTAVKVANWRSATRRFIAGEDNPPNRYMPPPGLDLVADAADVIAAEGRPKDGHAPAGSKLRQFSPLPVEPTDAAARVRSHWVTRRPNLDRHFALLEKFVQLCAEHGVQLTVATTPIERSKLDSFTPGDLEAVRERLNRITDLWDFSMPGLVSDRPELWIDTGHYKPAIGTMMIVRMFGGSAPVFPGFGRFLPRLTDPPKSAAAK
ncbi:MAG: hypothetical protein J0G37_14455 [Afipia sp.]|nr:hypothetical protein [Afipia sp.]